MNQTRPDTGDPGVSNETAAHNGNAPGYSQADMMAGADFDVVFSSIEHLQHGAAETATQTLRHHLVEEQKGSEVR